MLHPRIREAMKAEIATATSDYCLLVIPLLAESKGIDFIDRVLVVDTPIELQIERARLRDKVNAEEIQTIVDSQAERNQRLAIADDTIVNDTSIESLKEKVLALHNRYLSIAKSGQEHE